MSISSAIDVAVTGTDVFYVINDGQSATIMRVSATGGPASVVATVSDSFSPERLVASPRALFFQITRDTSDGGLTRQLLRVLPSGGAPALVAQLGGFVAPDVWFIADGQSLYFVDDDGTKRAPLIGDDVQMLTEQRGDLGLAGPNLLIADGDAGKIFRVPTSGGPSTLLAQGQGGASWPMACGDDICWIVGRTAPPSGADSIQPLGANGMPVGMPVPTCGLLDSDCVIGELVRLRAGARPMTLLASRGLRSIVEILFDRGDFFLSEGGDVSDGWIGKINGAGGPTVTAENAGWGFALDDTCLYWADSLGGVFSVAKSGLPAASPTPATSPYGCIMGEAGTAACAVGLGCAIPDAGPVGCTVCELPDGQAVDCKSSGQAMACGGFACGVGCTCEDMDAGVCGCGAP